MTTKTAEIDISCLRERLGLIVRLADGPKEVAYHVGISASSLYNYMHGRIPSIEVLFRLALYAGVPMEWFLRRTPQLDDLEPQIGSMSFTQEDPEIRLTGTLG